MGQRLTELTAIACLDDDFEVCIAHLHFPLAHRRAIRTTILLERLFGEERRRTKVIPHAFGERAVLKLMYAALISSSPDEGTLRLVATDPDRLIPFLRPYRGAVGSGNWTADPGLFEYLEGRLAARAYGGIGEFHLHSVGAREREVLARLVRLAESRGLYLHVHSDAKPVAVLFELAPRLPVLWAHAGMSEPASVVGAMLDRYPTLVTEVSFRAEDIAPGGALAPDWREVLLRHAERIMIGSDTWVPGRRDSYPALIEAHRTWLSLLPREVAEKIAFQNAVRLFKPARTQ